MVEIDGVYLMDDITRRVYFYLTFSIFLLIIWLASFVIYIIINHSTCSLKIYKWYMCNSILWTFIHTFNLFMFQPIPVYPVFSFIVNGPASKTSIAFMMFYQPFCLTSAFAACGSVGLRFFYRYVKVCNDNWFHYSLNVRWKSILFALIMTGITSFVFTGKFILRNNIHILN